MFNIGKAKKGYYIYHTCEFLVYDSQIANYLNIDYINYKKLSKQFNSTIIYDEHGREEIYFKTKKDGLLFIDKLNPYIIAKKLQG